MLPESRQQEYLFNVPKFDLTTEESYSEEAIATFGAGWVVPGRKARVHTTFLK
jgi:hypothetical protein